MCIRPGRLPRLRTWARGEPHWWGPGHGMAKAAHGAWHVVLAAPLGSLVSHWEPCMLPSPRWRPATTHSCPWPALLSTDCRGPGAHGGCGVPGGPGLQAPRQPQEALSCAELRRLGSCSRRCWAVRARSAPPMLVTEHPMVGRCCRGGCGQLWVVGAEGPSVSGVRARKDNQ